MKKVFEVYIAFFVLVFSSLLFGQKGVVAKVGNQIISEKEFVNRFEMTPRVNDEYPEDSAKINFLYSLIAEKLWAKEGERLRLNKTTYVKASIKNIKRKLLRDKLYKVVIEKGIKISSAELKKDLAKIHKKLILNFIFSNKKEEIKKLFQLLRKGIPFDTLLIKRKEYSEQINGIPVLYGDMNPELEKRVFALSEGENTAPIKVGKGWVIYHLKKIEYIKSHPKYPNKSDEKIAKDIIFDRKAKKKYQMFYNNKLKGKVVKTDKILSEKISNLLCDELKNNLSKAFNPNDKKYYLNYYAIIKLKKLFPEKDLRKPFLKFKNNPVTLSDFIEQLSIDGFSVPKCNPLIVRNRLHNYEKRFIYNSILERMAIKMGLENSADVENDLRIWRESFLANYYRNTLLDSVSVHNSEINEYYQQIKPLLPDSLKDKYSYVRKKLSAGLYFKKLNAFYEEKTADLAMKYGITINRKLLNSLETTKIEMLVYRYLGFGGTITAVPYSIPFYKWKHWLPKKLKTKWNKER